MPELDPSIRRYYEKGSEADRLSGGFPSGPLELERTKEIILRYLPPAPLEVLDVGGGPGVYAAWLANRGDRVRVVDPVSLHVNQARSAHPQITAEVGDARQLTQADASVDIVLLLGPLYHLVDRSDRLQALREAHRVLRPGGWLFAAAISRYAALMDLLLRAGKLHEPDILKIVSAGIESGVFHGANSDLFTTAYFHHPQELAEEVAESGFTLAALLGIEGPGSLMRDFEKDWADPPRREAILQAARLVESKAEMLVVSAHLLAVGHR